MGKSSMVIARALAEAVLSVLFFWEAAHVVAESKAFAPYPWFIRALLLIGLGVLTSLAYSAIWGIIDKVGKGNHRAGGRQPRGGWAAAHAFCLMLPFFGVAMVITYPAIPDTRWANRLLGIVAGLAGCVVGQLLVYGGATDRFRGIRRMIIRDENQRTKSMERRVLLWYALLSIAGAALPYRFVADVNTSLFQTIMPTIASVGLTYLTGSIAISILGVGRGNYRVPDEQRGMLVGPVLTAGIILAMFY